MLAAKVLQVLLEQSAHLDDTVSHALDLTEPLLVQGGVVHDGGGDAGAVDGRVGVQRTGEDLDLGVDALLLLGRLADEGEGTDTLTVETLESCQRRFNISPFDQTHHVLGETLAQSNVVALLDEVTGRKGIAVSVTTGKTLVGHVEEGEVVLLLQDIADLAPLLLRGVNTGRVVSASMEQDDALGRSGLEILDQTLKVQTDGVLVVVAVLVDLKAGVLEDGIVVGPAGSRDIDLLRGRVEALKESTSNAQGAGTGDGLSDGETVLCDHRGVRTVGQLGRSRCEGRDTSDTSVFLVEVRADNLVLCGADGGQDVGLALVITCSREKY